MATAEPIDLDAVRERLKACQFPSDNNHAQACSCAECCSLWQGGQAAGFARDRFIMQSAPELVAEVQRLRHLLERKSTACDEWISIANERRLELETLGKKGLGPLHNPRFDIESVRKKAAEAWADGDRHYAGDLNDLERCLKELEQTTLERVTLYNYVLSLEADVFRLEDLLRKKATP